MVPLATRRPTTPWALTPLLPPAGGPRTIPSTHRRTKPRTSCTQGFRSASLSSRPSLADADLCNPIAPAPSYRPAYPLSASSSPCNRKNGATLRVKPRDLRDFCGALGRTRTCDLLIRSLNWYVLTGSRLLANPANSGRKSGFALHLFSVPFGSVLSLLLPCLLVSPYLDMTKIAVGLRVRAAARLALLPQALPSTMTLKAPDHQ